MSIVKDLLLVSIFLFVVIKYYILCRQMAKQKEYFIDTLSHDLRVSTIAQIRGLELLKSSMNHKSEQSELISDINNSCRFTLDMITTLLNTYRFENREQVLKYETLDMNELIANSCESVYTKAVEKNIKFKILGKAHCLLEADKDCIKKVIKTLISTSIDYAEGKSNIIIAIDSVNNNFKFSVFYQGKALSDEECRRMFYQNPRFSVVGQGIRMHLCKKIIDFHSGKIFVKSCGKRINSFNFIMPISKKTTSPKKMFAIKGF